MAIEDYCRDDLVTPVPPSPDSGDTGTESGVTPVNPNTGGTTPDSIPYVPSSIPPPVPTPTPPFPMPINFGAASESVSSISDPSILVGPQAVSAQREVTIIPDHFFLTENIAMEKIQRLIFLRAQRTDNNENPRIRRYPIRGSTWFRESGIELEPGNKPDLLRWTLGAIWRSNGNHEKVVQRATGPYDNIYVGYNTRDAGPFEYGVLQFYGVGKNYGGIEHETESYRIEPIETEFGTEMRETIRFGFKYPRRRTNPFPLKGQSMLLNTEALEFLQTYMPDFQTGHPDEKYETFLRTLLLGDDMSRNRQGWQNFLRLLGSQKDANDSLKRETNSYRQGALIFDQLHHDYVFSAPVAFLEEELDSILLSPFHSAKISGQFSSLGFMDDRGYSSFYQIPNLYRLYNYLEIEKTYGSYQDRTNFAEQNAWNVASEYLENWRDPRISKDDETIYVEIAGQGGGTGSRAKYQDVVLKFPSDRVEKFEKINEFMKDYAPNFVEININTSQGGQINSFLQRNKMDRILLEMIHPSISDAGINAEQDLIDYMNPMNKFRFTIPDDMAARQADAATLAIYSPGIGHEGLVVNNTMVLDDSYKEKLGEQNVILRTINDRTESGISQRITTDFFDYLKVSLPNRSDSAAQFSYNGHYPLKYTGWNNTPMLRFEELIKSQIFVSQTEQFLLENNLVRTYADILNGQKAYSEVVGYKVDKHVIDIYQNADGSDQEVVSDPVQTMYFMDSNEIERITYLDTQVLPFQKYRYKIYTINFVVGTAYDFDYDSTIIREYDFDLSVTSGKRIYLIEAPYFEQDIEVRDRPPMPPQVSFLPFQGIDDKFGILLTVDYGRVKEKKIAITNSELQEQTEEEVIFRTDNLPTAFEWFRLEDPPESYSDFSSAVTDIVRVNNKSAFIPQNVLPNKYYYYTFRSLDHYDFENPDSFTNRSRVMKSNPTSVFRVRMVSYANGIFMEMEPYEMYREPKEFKMSFEQILKISPSFEDTAYNFSDTFDRIASAQENHIPNNNIQKLRNDLLRQNGNMYIADTENFQKTVPPSEEIKIGIKDRAEDLIWQRRFKFRIKSKNTGKTVDLNIKFAKDKIVIDKEQ